MPGLCPGTGRPSWHFLVYGPCLQAAGQVVTASGGEKQPPNTVVLRVLRGLSELPDGPSPRSRLAEAAEPLSQEPLAWGAGSMSLNAWEWEDEDRASVGPVSSVGSFHPSGSECEVDEDLQVGAWAQESESDHQCSSRSSAGSVSAVNSDVPHVVPCTFVISLAFPVTAGRKGKYSKLVEKHRKQPKMDRPVARVRSYCHLEYFLLPDDREPKRVDIVVFSGLAKVFLDSRIKTVRPWPEGDKVWVSWTQTFNIKVTKELLKKINFHKITLRLWDTKEKIPKRVKYYRLKAAAALEDVGSSVRQKELDWRKKSQKRRKKSRAEEESDSRMAGQGKQGAFSVQLAIMPLLAGRQVVVTRGRGRSANILDCFLTLETEVPIMTEEQKRDLNPLTIRIKCVSCLPTQPVCTSELERLCMPVYCQYQFHKTPVHRTEGQPHGTHVYFQDINVIFLGAMHPSDLREYLEGPPMLVEVHDRDRKSEEHSRKPTLLGEDPLDSCLNLQVHISPEETESNPFESQDKMWDPYGVARFGRVVFVFDSRKLSLLHGLLQDITTINARALGLDSHPFEDVEQILSAFKMRVKIQEKQDLDVLTGFHLLDGRVHLLILEGLADHGLRRLWEGHQSRIHCICCYSTRLREVITRDLLPSSAMIKELSQEFGLPVSQEELTEGKLVAPPPAPNLEDFQHRSPTLTDEIQAHQEKYLRWRSTMLLKHEDRQHSLVQLDSDSLRSRKTFSSFLVCISVSRCRVFQSQLRRLVLSPPWTKNITGAYQVSKKPPKPAVKVIKISAPAKDAVHNYSIQTLNSTELARKELYRQMAKTAWGAAGHLQGRGTLGRVVKQPAPYAVGNHRWPPLFLPLPGDLSSAAGLSIRTCTHFQEPRKRFTYSQNYLSAMVEPQDSEEEERKAKRKSRQAWLTPTGFQVTGLHRVESTEHLGLPAIGAPAEEWREKALFTNVLAPVLPRERWSWDRRHQDFELYKKPPQFLEPPPPPAPKPRAGTS
ncbi:hypothetical protein CB1_000465055 [Camelus ferus]|nr:hypothetical protein CB1_000465055 [Camelus ferus]